MSAFTATFAERFERAERDGELSPHAPDALALIASAAFLDALIDATVGVIRGRPD